MQPYLDTPYKQLGFILNLELHWFALRRFGPAQADATRDPGEGHWFNLNSFLSEPEWVSKTYLGMVLQQAELEGESFTCRVVHADQELRIFRLCCGADRSHGTTRPCTDRGG